MFHPCAIICLCAAQSPLHAEPAPAFDWCLITDPGNRDTTIEETIGFGRPGSEMGAVDYVYRILRTEVTLEQQLEFVLAYYPIYAKRKQDYASFDFVGFDIHASFAGIYIYSDTPPTVAGAISWEYLARYCNWLHHGKVNEPWAFETGVYDTSTFYEDPDGVYHHQLAHFPEARYWIPTTDEWVKAAHWDPTLDQGQGGYWPFPYRLDHEAVPGFPQDGGERNAGTDDAFPIAVASYPGTSSYYGLLDAVGGYRELLEDLTLTNRPNRRVTKGTGYDEIQTGSLESLDQLGALSSANVRYPLGFRISGNEFQGSDLNRDGRIDFFD
ncbi:MAG: SUMF1/EgtB/PvdO family nonheme iron enzyme, partial [Phycisphaerales bacterium]